MIQKRLAFSVLPLVGLVLGACGGDDGAADDDDDSTGETSTGDDNPTDTDVTVTVTVTVTDTDPDPDSSSDGSTTAVVDTSGTTEDDGSSSSSSTTGPVCDPEVVELPGDAFFPESIAVDSTGQLYVGSITSGEILRITPCEGDVGEHVVESWEAGDTTIGALGIVVDETNDVLWVCSSDVTGTLPPAILAYDLGDASLVATHAFDFGFCNDMAFDAEGNLYASESFGSRIMRVDAADLLMDTEAEEWSTDSMYAVDPGMFGLNGIAHDEGVIYTVNYTVGEMYATAINLNGTAANPQLVDLADTTLLGPDGMRQEATGTFLVIEQLNRSLDRITLAKGGNTVDVLDMTFDFPTAFAVVDTNVWVVESQLDHLIDPDANGPAELPFVIVRRTLP